MDKKIVILGSGPTGLGAAWRLKELKHGNYKVFEKNPFPGGLASSFVDEKGFTWDVGGHVLFSHYEYFDKLMELLLKDQWLTHERESWIWIKNRFVPYPIQNNIRYMPKEDMWKCLSGIIELYKNSNQAKPLSFKEWILATFGQGLAELFMFPYNYKVWAYHPEKMSYSWIGERIAVTDLKRVTENILFEKDDLSWGPNNTFKFPLRGGTGEIWRQLYERLDKENIFLNSEVTEINTMKKEITVSGKKERYDTLISTIPLDIFINRSDIKDKTPAKKLLHSSVNIFGLGLKGAPSKELQKKCWMYFPEDNCPFYRVTLFSKYSPNNVPDIKKYWSLMFEVSESTDKSVNHNTIKEEVIQGAINTKLIKSRSDIVSYWEYSQEYGYPTPSLERDEGIKVLKDLEKRGVYSRGRFGAWKYEVGNMDHSLMQGVEAVNKIMRNEEEMTVWHPEIANKKK
jgi:protoporphyrinogen oxidase